MLVTWNMSKSLKNRLISISSIQHEAGPWQEQVMSVYVLLFTFNADNCRGAWLQIHVFLLIHYVYCLVIPWLFQGNYFIVNYLN